MAPEVILGSDYNQKADVFSYGNIYLCILSFPQDFASTKL